MFQSPYLHFTLVAGGFFLFAFLFFITRLSGAFAQLRRKWNPPSPYQPNLLKYNINAATFWAFFVLIGLLLLGLSYYLSRYQYIAGGKATLAGSAKFARGRVEFTSEHSLRLVHSVKGHQAAAAGVFLRFPAWSRFLGLGTYHKLIGFRGFNENEYHYKKPDASYLASFVDSLFLFCYENRKWLSVPEAFYTESPYFNPGKRRIFVTNSGYIVN